jgi:hypothetical protein
MHGSYTLQFNIFSVGLSQQPSVTHFSITHSVCQQAEATSSDIPEVWALLEWSWVGPVSGPRKGLRARSGCQQQKGPLPDVSVTVISHPLVPVPGPGLGKEIVIACPLYLIGRENGPKRGASMSRSNPTMPAIPLHVHAVIIHVCLIDCVFISSFNWQRYM